MEIALGGVIMRTVKSVKNSLKFKAKPRLGVLSVRLGGKRYDVPIEARMLYDSNYLFLSFPSCSDLFEIKAGALSKMNAQADASAAYEALNPPRQRGRKKGAPASLPVEVAEVLKSIPPGYRIGYDAQGVPRLVRRRVRVM